VGDAQIIDFVSTKGTGTVCVELAWDVHQQWTVFCDPSPLGDTETGILRGKRNKCIQKWVLYWGNTVLFKMLECKNSKNENLPVDCL